MSIQSCSIINDDNVNYFETSMMVFENMLQHAKNDFKPEKHCWDLNSKDVYFTPLGI